MKKLSFVAGVILWCTTATAGVYTTPMDTTRTKMEIKKADFKKSGNTDETPQKALEVKAAEKMQEVESGKSETKPAETAAKPMSRSTAEEMKNMAKRDSKKTEEKPETPTVSYPYYPGGNIAVREFVRKNLRYPQECKRERLTGRVEVLISIAPDGTPHSATISKSSGNVHMDAEALRIAELMPKWQPAEESDDPQSIDYVIYVNFRPGR